MVTYEGYCRPLKQKVEFVVESIDSLETKRGIKWSVKGNYQGHKISTFTNQDTAEDLLSKMSKNPTEEIEVFGAEIAHIPAGEAEVFDAEEVILEAPKIEHDMLEAKHYRKDGSLDLRYKICREISATEKKNAESKTVETVEKKTKKITKEDKKVIDEVEDVATEVAVDSVMDAESFDAETYNKVYKAEPNAIIFEENIPAEVWNIMGPDAQGHYLSTRDESVLIAPCCGVTKEELRIDNDANMDCISCCFSGDDFHPRWWADKPKPEVRLTHGAEEAPMDLTYGNTATVPVDVYYKFMLELPPTVSATVTDDGLSMILGFHNQNADLIDALIEGYSPYQDAGNPEDTLYAEDTLSFVPSDFNSTSFEAESDRLNSHYSNTLKFTDEELDKLGELYMAAESFEAEMTCPPATKDVAINTKNRNATIKNFGYGPLNVEEPGDFWEKIAKQWDTTEKAAKKSKCGNCVAFDRSPRMKACMPGETSDGEGVLGYCWMHHFKCHSARTCDTWAKGGPITTDKVSEGWQERAFAKTEKKDAESSDLAFWLMPGIGNDIFDTKEEAMERAKELGVNEIHQHKIINNSGTEDIIFMPYKSHQEYERKEGAKRNLGDNLPFNVEFEDWGKQEMKTHGKDVSFKDWLEEESKSHGDVPLTDWAEHEEESHDERYGAEEDRLSLLRFNNYFEEEVYRLSPDIYAEVFDKIDYNHEQLKEAYTNPSDYFSMKGSQDRMKQFQNRVRRIDENIYQRAMETAQMRVAKEEEDFEAEGEDDDWADEGIDPTIVGYCYDCNTVKPNYGNCKCVDDSMTAESFEADATSCFECGRFGYDDEMMRIDYGHLCARCANPDVDFSKIMRAEESPKITKKLIGLLGIGALGAVLAPKEIRKLFDKFKKS